MFDQQREMVEQMEEASKKADDEDDGDEEDGDKEDGDEEDG